jgi:N-methylhydantoinase A
VVNALMEEMHAEALAVVRQGTSRQDLQETRQAYMRYIGQGHEIPVSLPVEVYTDTHAEVFRQLFEAVYTRLYGRTIAGIGIEVLSWTLTITAPVEMDPESRRPEPFFGSKKSSDPLPVSLQSCFDSTTAQRSDVPVYLRELLRAGDHIAGPALITEDQTTTVVTSSFHAAIDHRGYIVLTRIKSSSPGKNDD